MRPDPLMDDLHHDILHPDYGENRLWRTKTDRLLVFIAAMSLVVVLFGILKWSAA